MKRFRVVKASHLAFAAAAVLLAAVVIALAIRYVSAQDAQPAGMIYTQGEAAQAAFAASGLQIEVIGADETESPVLRPMFIPEDEHTDAVSSVPAPKIRPSVLIYHTHTHEAYQPTADSRYEEAYDRWRTTDNQYNVVRVGEALKAALEAEGIHVVHDMTDHEQNERYRQHIPRNGEQIGQPPRGLRL